MAIFKHKIIADKERVKRFRTLLSAFFICLIIPLSLIIYYTFEQVETEMDLQYQGASVKILNQINKKLNHRLKVERKRTVRHYNFYQLESNPITGKVTKALSPLADPANYPENVGLIGYFQINSDKTLSSPLLPYQTREQIVNADTSLDWQEIERRIAINEKLKNILLDNEFEIIDADHSVVLMPDPSIKIKKESFQVKVTKDNKFIVFRNFWLNQQHQIQGFIVDQDAYLNNLIMDFFSQGHYESKVQLRLKFIHSNTGIFKYFNYIHEEQGGSHAVLMSEGDKALDKKYIHHGYVIAPFQKLQLKFSTDQYPLNSSSEVVVLFFVVLIIVIIAGCLGFYWLGLKQIELAEQRMNFVSSVSHELKTPLTSILMYSEMLKSGMVNDLSSQQDYHEFIFGESSRLSRLISNILKLSNLNRQQEIVSLVYVDISSLKDTIQSKVSSLIEKNAFKVNFSIDKKLNNNAQMLVDLDAFSQIVINLVDNAVKFFNAAKITDQQRRQIDISFDLNKNGNNKIIFSVRDYGPGILNSEHNRIFELFYRQGNEMTRTTPGTGIGLALVHELVLAQGGDINVIKSDLGAKFSLTFDARNS